MVFEASMEPFPGSFLSAEHLATEDGYYVNNLQESIEVTTGRGLTFGYDYFGNFGLSLFLGMASKKELYVMPRDLFSPKKVFTLSYLLIKCWTWNAPRFLHFSTPEIPGFSGPSGAHELKLAAVDTKVHHVSSDYRRFLVSFPADDLGNSAQLWAQVLQTNSHGKTAIVNEIDCDI